MAPRRDHVSHGFIAGGLGDMTAALVSHPADVLKVRMQLTGEGQRNKPVLSVRDYLDTARKLVHVEGVGRGLYGGISASLLRLSLFSSLRHGLYGAAERRFFGDGAPMPLLTRCGLAVSAGCVAALVANPVDVILIRMQADGHLPAEQRRRYGNVFSGLARLWAEEGPGACWRGCGPTVLRAALVTGAQITTYKETKEAALGRGMQDGLKLQMLCAATSATVACLATSPVDVVKTRLMNMQNGHSISYTGPRDCVMQIVRSEGPLAFYKGLSATFLRLWPHTMVLWVMQEKYMWLLQHW